ncbi:MAG: mechanosensitive ion channel family protein, partial [Pseudomonadota bacterium]
AFMIVDVIWRMAVSPYMAEYRLPRLGDRAARQLYGWLVGISAFGIVNIASTAWLEALGLQAEHRLLIVIALNLLLIMAVVVLISVNRAAIAGIILAGKTVEEASWVTLVALRLWAPLIIIYLIAAWGKLTFQMIIGVPVGDETMIVPYAVLMVGLLAYATTSYLIERIFTRSRRMQVLNTDPGATDHDHTAIIPSDAADVDADGDEESGAGTPKTGPEPVRVFLRPRATMRTFEDLARRVASLFAIGAAAWALLFAWGGQAAFAESAYLGIVEDLIDILFIGYITYHAVRIWIDQKIEDEGGDEVATGPLDGEGGGTGATRLATLLPLVRNFILAIILIAVGLVVATELGINVAPLFAGAGIVGLAIGFGSQTLVRDILSGAFFLMDDAFRKGEYIDVGDVKGTVEKISIRSFQLRHHLGMLHTIPFGEIQYLTNFSRDWVMMKLPLRVTYDTDVERVRKMIKKLGLQLLDDPVVGSNFIQPLKSQGVVQMDDSAMIIRVKFMTKPGDQWVVRKRVFQEIRDLFDREGIKFAHREVTVRIPDLPQNRELKEAEVKAIGAAARRIGDQQADEMMATGTSGPVDDR